jgi:hypothetical protein
MCGRRIIGPSVSPTSRNDAAWADHVERNSRPLLAGKLLLSLLRGTMTRKNCKKELQARFSDLRASRADIGSKINAAAMRAMGADFGAIAREALTISKDNSSIQAVFDQSGLDKSNPLHWRILMEILTDVLLAPTGKKGRQATWIIERYNQLLTDLYDLEEKYPGRKRTHLCKLLIKAPDYRERYAGLSAESLRRRSYEAAALVPNFQRCIPVAERRGSGETSTFSFLPEEAFEPLVREILSSIGEREGGS